MNETQIRRKVHEAIGATIVPFDFGRSLERRLRQPARHDSARFAGVGAAILTVLIVGTLVVANYKATTTPKAADGSHTYSVTAVVEIQRDGSTDICYPWFSLTTQSKCDFTVPLQADIATLPKARTLYDGTIWTAPVELTGTWTGKKLVVTSKPKPMTELTMPPRPGLGSGTAPNDPPESYFRNEKTLLADKEVLMSRGLWIAESGWSKAGFYVIFVAADQSSIDYVKTHYSANVVVSWFRFIS